MALGLLKVEGNDCPHKSIGLAKRGTLEWGGFEIW